MSELNIKIGENQRAIPAPATVADAIKALDRDVLKRSLAAKVTVSSAPSGCCKRASCARKLARCSILGLKRKRMRGEYS